MAGDCRFLGALLLATACAASVPSVKVVANLRGGDFAPVAAGAGFVVTGNQLTAWRPQQLRVRRSVDDHPGAIAIAHGGRACATAAAAPALGLRSYRLPGLEPIQSVADACNDEVSISPGGGLVACIERRVEASQVQTHIRVFTFPDLKPVQAWGPLRESVESLSFEGAQENRLAVVVTFVDPARRADGYQSRIDLYDARAGSLVGEFSQKGRFPQLAYASQGDIFVWAGEPGAQAWSVRSHAQLRAFSATAHTIALALSPDGHLLATSQGQHSTDDQRKEGGGTIQIFATRSGDLLATFGSAELRAATQPHDSDQMLSERAQVHVQFELLGDATVKGARPVFRDLFGGPSYIADHQWLAFSDNDTLVSAGRGFFALWTLNQESILKARGAK